MSKRSRARFQAFKRKQERLALRLVASAPVIDPGPRVPVWTAPCWRELEGNEGIIRRAYARFSPDHLCHACEPDYAADYTSPGAVVLGYIPAVTPAPAMRIAA